MKFNVLFLVMLAIFVGCSKDDDSTPKEDYKLTITYTTELGHVEIDPLLERYPKGTVVKVKAIPNEEAAFKNWEMNSTTTNQKEIAFSIDSDTELAANFIEIEQKNFSLATSCEASQGAITVTPQKDSYPMGTSVKLSAIAKDGYKFSHWEGIESTDATIQIDMTANFSIKAIFVNNNGAVVASSDVLFTMNIRWDKDEQWKIESELSDEKTSKEISGAVIKVNNNQLAEDDFFKGSYAGTIEDLTPGQKVIVTVQYNQENLKTFEVIVPPVFTVKSALTGNLKDGIVTLNWENLNCSGYVLRKSIENTMGTKAEMTVSDGSLLNTTTYSEKASNILSSNVSISPAPQYFTLWVCPANKLSNLQGFYAKSYIQVTGKKSNSVTNKAK